MTDMFHATYTSIQDIIFKASKDPVFRERLIENPHLIFKEKMVSFDVKKEIKVFENTPEQFYFVLPGKSENLLKVLKESNAQLAQVVEKAWMDTEFKKNLVASPRETIIEETAMPLPEFMELHILEDTDQLINIVIPFNMDMKP